jgi:two-component system heavy metal sensor histidine kinase CusS
MQLRSFVSRTSLAGRLTTWYTAASLLLLTAATGLLYWALASELNRDGDLFFTDKVNVIRTILRDQPEDREALREEVQLESAARTYDQFYIRLLNESGAVVMETPGMRNQLEGVAFPEPTQGPRFQGLSIENRLHIPFRVLSARLPVGDAPGLWTMQIAVNRKQQQELLARYRHWLWGIWAFACVLCPLLGHRIATRGTRPLREIGETARRISSQTLNERIDGSGYPVEVAALAQVFNAMLDRLEESFARLSQFSADLAHELRTPVNNIRGEAEVALARARSVDDYREVLGSCLEEAARLSQLISDLLFLARSENPGEHLRLEPVSAVAMLSTVRDYFEANAAQQGVELLIDCDPLLSAEVDRQLIQRAVGNLVSNALAHTPKGGTVSLRACQQRGVLQVQVADNGTGIPAGDLRRVFDRFFRVDRVRSPSSGGTGLGLAIVQGIVGLHGGAVSIDSELGKGTIVTLKLPIRCRPTAARLQGNSTGVLVL